MKMKKGLIALLLTLPMALTSCLDGSDSEPSPVAPGIEIYFAATFRNQLSLLPTNVAIRLAMILGEADKRGLSDDEMLNVKDEKGNLLKDLLFSSTTTITAVDTKFVIDIPNDNTNLYHDGSSPYIGSYSGKVEVETYGNFVFDSDSNEAWEITVSDLKYHNGGISYLYDNGCKSSLQGDGGIYWISTEDFNCVHNEFRFLDNWRSSRMQLSTATMVNLAYSNVKDGEFTIDGYGQDANFKWDGKATFKAALLDNDSGFIGLLQSGTIEARYLAPDRDLESFPSDYVKVSVSSAGYMFTYNGYSGTK